MTQNELSTLIEDQYRKTFEATANHIKEEIEEALDFGSNKTQEEIIAAIGVATTTSVKLSVAVTINTLIKLGVIKLDIMRD